MSPVWLRDGGVRTHAPHYWGDCTESPDGISYYPCRACPVLMLPSPRGAFYQQAEGAIVRQRPPCERFGELRTIVRVASQFTGPDVGNASRKEP